MRARLIALAAACVCVLGAGAHAASAGSAGLSEVAESRPIAGGLAAGGETGHGWAVVRARTGDGWMLVHLPPRSRSGTADPSASGTVRPILDLEGPGEALVAVGTRLYRVDAPVRTPEGGLARPIGSLSVRPAGLRDYWSVRPHGRWYSETPGPGEGELVGAAGLERGNDSVLALLVQEGPRLRLLERTRDGWDELALPVELSSDDARALLTRRGSLCLVASEGGRALSAYTRGDGGEWSRESFMAPAEGTAMGFRSVGGELLVLTRVAPDRAQGADGRALVRLSVLVRDDEPRTVAEVPGVWTDGTVEAAGVVLHDPARLAVLWSEAAGAPPPRKPSIMPSGPPPSEVSRRLMVHELSVLTGREFYRGPAVQGELVSPGGVRVMAALVFVMTLLTLLAFVRGDPDRGQVALPEGWALASPMRRVAAFWIDAVLAGAAAWLIGVRPEGLLLIEIAFSEPGQRWVYATCAIGFAASAATECALGCTPGKWAMRLRVRAVRAGEGGRLPLARCVLRNACRWLVWPLTLLALFEMIGRHRGDVLSGAAVLVRHAGSGQPSEPTQDG